jgi:hypothetical protein
MNPSHQRDTPAWIAFVWISFCTSVFLMCTGIYYLPVDGWIRGYMVMALFFVVGSTFTLSKTIRDNFEIQKMISRATEAKTEQIIKKYEMG